MESGSDLPELTQPARGGRAGPRPQISPTSSTVGRGPPCEIRLTAADPFELSLRAGGPATLILPEVSHPRQWRRRRPFYRRGKLRLREAKRLAKVTHVESGGAETGAPT